MDMGDNYYLQLRIQADPYKQTINYCWRIKECDDWESFDENPTSKFSNGYLKEGLLSENIEKIKEHLDEKFARFSVLIFFEGTQDDFNILNSYLKSNNIEIIFFKKLRGYREIVSDIGEVCTWIEGFIKKNNISGVDISEEKRMKNPINIIAGLEDKLNIMENIISDMSKELYIERDNIEKKIISTREYIKKSNKKLSVENKESFYKCLDEMVVSLQTSYLSTHKEEIERIVKEVYELCHSHRYEKNKEIFEKEVKKYLKNDIIDFLHMCTNEIPKLCIERLNDYWEKSGFDLNDTNFCSQNSKSSEIVKVDNIKAENITAKVLYDLHFHEKAKSRTNKEYEESLESNIRYYSRMIIDGFNKGYASKMDSILEYSDKTIEEHFEIKALNKKLSDSEYNIGLKKSYLEQIASKQVKLRELLVFK